MQTDLKVQGNTSNDEHGKLLRIAILAERLVWVVLVIFVLAAGARWLSLYNYYTALGNAREFFNSFEDQFRHNLSFSFSILVDVASVFMQGIVYALVLKGVSLGLFMVVETDLNYRATQEEEDETNEQ